MSRFVLGTAGHIDHGKTALVKRLTGVDTDRWEEEKRRGITIDLGFAAFENDGVEVSVVDVPGHEDFIRNMVAGASGMDAVLLVVAADEGVMPQTREHLNILKFLGVRSGIPVITKSDLAEPDWIDLVVSEVREVIEDSGVNWLDAVVVSSRSGKGIDRLRETITDLSRSALVSARPTGFRMPVDRSFIVDGTGTVVTGTVWSGRVEVSDRVQVLPGGFEARVRGVQVHGSDMESAGTGSRAAVALAGVDRRSIGRGSALVAGDGWRAVPVFDAEVALLSESAVALDQRTRVRVHIGTDEVIARVTPAASRIEPGETGVVRFRLDRPTVAAWGDLGIVRSYSPVSTIGGLRVVDPAPPQRPRRPPADAASGIGSPDLTRRLHAFAAREPIKTTDAPVRLGIDTDDLDEMLLHNGDFHLLSGSVVPGRVLDRAVAELEARLESYHSPYPLREGMPLGEVRQLLEKAVGLPVDPLELSSDSVKVVAGSMRLAAFRPKLTDPEQRRITRLFEEASFQGLSDAEFADLGVDIESADFLVRAGDLVRLPGDRWLAAAAAREASEMVRADISANGPRTAAELRDTLGLTRKYLIPLLEWLDSEGVTRRSGDVRVLSDGLRGSGSVDT